MEKYLGLKDDGTYYAAKREAEFLNFYQKTLDKQPQKCGALRLFNQKAYLF